MQLTRHQNALSCFFSALEQIKKKRLHFLILQHKSLSVAVNQLTVIFTRNNESVCVEQPCDAQNVDTGLDYLELDPAIIR